MEAMFGECGVCGRGKTVICRWRKVRRKTGAVREEQVKLFCRSHWPDRLARHSSTPAGVAVLVFCVGLGVVVVVVAVVVLLERCGALLAMRQDRCTDSG